VITFDESSIKVTHIVDLTTTDKVMWVQTDNDRYLMIEKDKAQWCDRNQIKDDSRVFEFVNADDVKFAQGWINGNLRL
jgi:hypothetical protein